MNSNLQMSAKDLTSVIVSNPMPRGSGGLVFSETSLAANFSVNYSGRLTHSDGSPLEGPVSIQVKFWNASTDGAQIGQTLDYSGINLSSGVFALDLVFTADQVTAVFGDGSSPVYIEITSQNITYPRQQFSYVPFALKVPVDSKTLTYGNWERVAGGHLCAHRRRL